ncbi:hypothetical protein CFR75_06055 [Komagataeibacter xylinus]|uniref:Bro-N domain-containing protein n=1 Tax=Komagataeibacter xylinus TaxID=28448 RepID=A0A318PJ19_KOMXY|nr:BRO family protein [Komagataeibacter xylinus]PYD57379.1 hypothetical protein CFR75_06055 [Komagataeibacter xylinus]GBQ80627.1 prophage antirepressor [Komagataeibacter xylinus NBRC 15237]
MTDNLIPFAFGEKLVRVVSRDGEPWWVLSDVCAVLEIRNHKDASTRLDVDEKSGVGITDPHGREQVTTVINESGLWSLVLTSRKPEAKRFKKWVTAEVLPSIRRTGSYRHAAQAVEADGAEWFSRLSRVVHAWYSPGGEAEARRVWSEQAMPFPMPRLDGVLLLMEAALGDGEAAGISGTSALRRISSRHNGALGGRPRKGENAAQARVRRLHLVEKEVIPSENGQEATVMTYSTQPQEKAFSRE